MGSTSLERAWERVLAGSQNNDGTWDLPELRHQQPATTKRCEMREERAALSVRVWKLQYAQLPTPQALCLHKWNGEKSQQVGFGNLPSIFSVTDRELT